MADDEMEIEEQEQGEDAPIVMQPVESKRVKALGHSGTTLRATFPNGKTAEYEGVPAEVFEMVMGSPSVGAAFGEFIVDGGYGFHYV